jgi:hypothetical protein
MKNQRQLRRQRVFGVAVTHYQHRIALGDRLHPREFRRSDWTDDEFDALPRQRVGRGGSTLGGVFAVDGDDVDLARRTIDLDQAVPVGFSGDQFHRTTKRQSPLCSGARQDADDAER